MSPQFIVAVLLVVFAVCGYFVGYWKRQDEIDGLKRDVRALTHGLEQTEEIVRVQEQMLTYRRQTSTPHPAQGRRLRVVKES